MKVPITNYEEWKAALEACVREMVPSPKSLEGLGQTLLHKWYDEQLEPRAAAKLAVRRTMEVETEAA